MAIEYNKGCFDDGYTSRLNKHPRELSPSGWGKFGKDSWLAGWDKAQEDSKNDPNFPESSK